MKKSEFMPIVYELVCSGRHAVGIDSPKGGIGFWGQCF
jgi:hypothetical protein